MNNPRSNEEQPFGELLRHEAHSAEPEFSEALHTRICGALRQSRANGAVRNVATRRVRLAWAPLAAVAALILIAVYAWRSGWPAKHAELLPLPVPDASPVALAHAQSRTPLPELADRAAFEVDRLIREKLVTEQLAYLEHDAQVLANAITGGSLRGVFPNVLQAHESSPVQVIP